MATGKTRLSEEDIEAIQAYGGLVGETDRIADDIAIVGTGPSMYALPKDNPYEVWGCNGAAWEVDCDRVFIMDGMAACRKTNAEFARYMEHVRVPIYLPERDPAVPASIGFGVGSGSGTCTPLWHQVFNTLGVPWVGSTIGYMIAFAIYRGVKRIHFYGCDMIVRGYNNHEYADQIPAQMLWMGIAIGRGLQLHFPAQTVLSMPMRYGAVNGVPGTVKSDGTFIDGDGKKWVEYEQITKRIGNLTLTEEIPVGSILGTGVERKLLGARAVEE